MLGEQIGEAKGKSTGQRVLDVEGGLPKIETSYSVGLFGLLLDLEEHCMEKGME